MHDVTDRKPELDLMDDIIKMDEMVVEADANRKHGNAGGQRQAQLNHVDEERGGLAGIFSLAGGMVGGGLLPFCSDDDTTNVSSSMGVANSNNNIRREAMSCWANAGRGAASPVAFDEDSSGNCNVFGWSCLTSRSKVQSNGSSSNTFLQASSYPINVSSSRRGGTSSPNTKNPTEETDKLLSNELKRLTMVEREKVTEDIHGIAEVIDENVDFVRQKIQQFDEEIAKLRKRHARITTSNYTAAYEKALFINPQLVQRDVDFKLMFLRGDNFDPEKAANRLMMYFTTKLELFGLGKSGDHR